MYYFQWFLETFYVQASVKAVNTNIKTIIIQVNDIPGHKLVYFNRFLWFMLLKLLIVNFIYISISSIVNKFSLLCLLKKSCFLVGIKIIKDEDSPCITFNGSQKHSTHKLAVNANIKTIIIQVNDIPGYKLVYFNHSLWFMLLKLLIVNFIYISISSIVNKFSLLCSLKKSCFLVEIKICIILYKR